jgi:clan AA aspartic protease
MLRGIFENNCPYIELQVFGSSEPVTVRALIDTGFNGYLTLPYHMAFPLGFTLIGIGSVVVADGSSSPHLSCFGTIMIANKRIKAIIDVQPNCKVLMGMQLVKDLKLSILIDPVKNKVELTEE